MFFYIYVCKDEKHVNKLVQSKKGKHFTSIRLIMIMQYKLKQRLQKISKLAKHLTLKGLEKHSYFEANSIFVENVENFHVLLGTLQGWSKSTCGPWSSGWVPLV